MGGGLLLLVTCVLMRCTKQPVRRQRLGDLGLLAALLTALLCAAGPSWLVIAQNRANRSAGFQPVLNSDLIASNLDRSAEQPGDLHAAHLEILDPLVPMPLPAR